VLVCSANELVENFRAVALDMTLASARRTTSLCRNSGVRRAALAATCESLPVCALAVSGLEQSEARWRTCLDRPSSPTVEAAVVEIKRSIGSQNHGLVSYSALNDAKVDCISKPARSIASREGSFSAIRTCGQNYLACTLQSQWQLGCSESSPRRGQVGNEQMLRPFHGRGRHQRTVCWRGQHEGLVGRSRCGIQWRLFVDRC